MNLPKSLIVVAVSLCLGVASGARAQTFDSFFDVFTDLMVDGKIDYQSTASTSYSSVDTEMISMSLHSSANPNVVITPQPDGSLHVDSFFDITYQVGPTGGPFSVDSFFDVPAEITVGPPQVSGDSHTFDTEILSLDLSSAIGPTGPDVLGLAASTRHRGHVTVLKLAGGGPGGGPGFQVDSFFDIFTDISLDGGATSSPADAATPLAFGPVLVPEPSSALLFVGGLAFSTLSRRRRKR